MKHWIEPQILADAQRTGFDSGSATIYPHVAQGPQHHDLQHYVNRPGQLSGLSGIKDMTFGWGSLLLAAAGGILLSTQIKGILKAIKKKV